MPTLFCFLWGCSPLLTHCAGLSNQIDLIRESLEDINKMCCQHHPDFEVEIYSYSGVELQHLHSKISKPLSHCFRHWRGRYRSTKSVGISNSINYRFTLTTIFPLSHTIFIIIMVVLLIIVLYLISLSLVGSLEHGAIKGIKSLPNR